MSEVETPPAERPEHIPEKFWKDGKVDTDGLAKSYVELEKLASRKAAAEGNQDLAIPPKETLLPETEDDALKAAGLTEGELAKSLTDSGTLTDDQYAKFKKAGFPKYVVDRWVQARVVLAESVRDAVVATAGGEDEYHKLTSWAAANAEKPAVDAFNRAIQRGTPAEAREQVELMQYRYDKANGTSGSRRLISGTAAPGGSGGFTDYEDKLKAASAVQNGKMTMEEYRRRLSMTDPKFHRPPRRA